MRSATFFLADKVIKYVNYKYNYRLSGIFRATPPPQLVGLVTLLVQHIFLIQRSRRVAGRLHVIHVRLLVGELFEQ